MILKGNNDKFLNKKYWFHVLLLLCIALPIASLMVLDYLNIESNAEFNKLFYFLNTWKGRMFYIFFLWLLFLESIINWEEIVKAKPENYSRLLFSIIVVFTPLFYVLSVNFWGFDQFVLDLGRGLGFSGLRLVKHWVLSFEYSVFTFPFLIGIVLAYGKNGLKFFSVSLSLLIGVSIFYTLDTFYPEGTLKPLELLALPTAACAAALLDSMGYSFVFQYIPGPKAMPIITLNGVYRIGIAWPCAGVHSLFLYLIIISLLFKKSSISNFRKLIYFIIGVVGTYFVNILRIASYFVILKNDGISAAEFFHRTTGELYFFFWMFAYILLIIVVERFTLVERIRLYVKKIFTIFRKGKKV